MRNPLLPSRTITLITCRTHRALHIPWSAEAGGKYAFDYERRAARHCSWHSKFPLQVIFSHFRPFLPVLGGISCSQASSLFSSHPCIVLAQQNQPAGKHFIEKVKRKKIFDFHLQVENPNTARLIEVVVRSADERPQHPYTRNKHSYSFKQL